MKRSSDGARGSRPIVDAARKLEAVREAAEHAYPTGDIDELLRQVDSGWLESEPGPLEDATEEAEPR